MADKKEKRYVSDNAQLMAEWDWEKNNELGLYPDKITYGSNKKVWWVCSEKQHKWQQTPNARITKKTRCPYCNARILIVGQNDLGTIRPDLAKDWDFEKNFPLTPKDVKEYSNKKVWWVCEKGHKWQSTVSNRSLGNGCPTCGYSKGAKTRTQEKIKKSGSLQERFPNIALEWDYTKNENSPNEILPSSNKMAWWICPNHHSYPMKISHRKDGHGCPYCANSKVLSGWNDLETWCNQTGDKTLLRWDYKKNKDVVNPNNISKGSKKIVWWKCDICGYEYKNKIANEIANIYCPKCNKRNKTSFPEQAIFYYIKILFPDAINGYKNTSQGISELDIYIPSIKLGIEYDGKAWHTGNDSIKKEKRKFEACEKNGIKLIRFREHLLKSTEIIAHEILESSYQEDIETFNCELYNLIKRYDTHISVDIGRDKLKIYESYLSILRQRSLESMFPHIAKEWDYENNHPLKPNMVSAFCNEKFWFVCNNNHSYLMAISKRTSRGDSCPICSGHKVLKGFNDLETTHPNLCNEWDYEKNDFQPSSISKGYDKKVWWKCSNCGHSFYTSPNTRTSQGTGCSRCNGGISKKVSQYTLNGDFIKTYESTGQVSKEMNVSASLISRACTKHTPALNFQWRYTDTVTTNKIDPYQKRLFNNKSVEQYTLDGRFVKTYESVTIAKNETGASKIGDVCNGKRKQSGGYIWKYTKSHDI